MATPLPTARFVSPHSFACSRCPFLYSFSRPSLIISSEKSVWAPAFSPRRRRECGICFASRRRSQTTSTSAAIFSEDETEDWEDDAEEEEEEEEGGEDMPLREVVRWLKNKPAGFGEGMRYDTKVEDKLLEEIKRNKNDQLEGTSKPRASKKENARSVKKQEKQMVTEVIKTDPEVRVWNLPKKKNIDRDLRKAFKGFPGIISINPAVTGNKKTRDPICMGFAFIGFESDDAAYGFVRKYSKQNLLFGKVQKQISCDVINVHGVFNSSESSKSSSYNSPNKSDYRHSKNELCIPNASEISNSNNCIEPNDEEFPVLLNDTNISSSNNENEGNEDLQFNTPTLAYRNRKKNDKLDKAKPPKPSKGRILGSLAKLKIKDRVVLTGVFSKYGEVALAASKKI